MKQKRLLLLLALLMTAATGTWAQTVIGNGWSDDFEGATCNWDLINGSAANKWTLGTATNNGGTQAIYISNDGGTTNTYVSDTGCASTVYAAKLFTFANDEYTFSYDWKANGENNWDYLRVALVPSSVTLTAKATSTDHKSTLSTGWIALDSGSQLKRETDWQNKSVTIDVSAGDYYLVFEWINDFSTACDPPAAIDNVSITPSSASSALFNLTFKPANANTIEAGKATVTVGGTAATVTEGKLEGVKMGSEVKMTAKQGYKFRKVEVKKSVPKINVGGLELIGEEGQAWSTIVANNPDKIEITETWLRRKDNGLFLKPNDNSYVNPNTESYNSSNSYTWYH